MGKMIIEYFQDTEFPEWIEITFVTWYQDLYAQQSNSNDNPSKYKKTQLEKTEYTLEVEL